MGNATGFLETQDVPWMNQGQSLTITLPPLAGIVLQLQGEPALTAEPEGASAQAGPGTLPSP